MRVVVASRNPVKIRAVREAFGSQFPATQIDVQGVDVDTGVSHQPYSDEETRTGARNRAAAAAGAVPEAAFWVGLEGGIEFRDDSLMAFAWMAIRGRDGAISEARSVTLPLPPAVGALLEAGLELGEANDRVFGTVDSKREGGAYGLLTGGRYTRESIYTQTLVIALVPFVNALYPNSVQAQSAGRDGM